MKWESKYDKRELQFVGRHLFEGALEGFGKWVVIAFIVFAIVGALASGLRVGFDSTDSPHGKRSNMRLRTDYGTGCQYLESSAGHLTPRLNAEGSHVCPRFDRAEVRLWRAR